ncbi:flagellar FliL protein [Natronospira proteinivora]|uniref:Flagellar protein FliL n=1 Tax=Natronospira proteinivora TaxID=1807133 RepID=A0ABT1G912_9GAMM|nr:flagellar basal body-associated FliL family protein [Natronospira proteinivora]MCP1726442.1 flagellar FliL protein [Natronospira proteinivora]
MKAWFIGGIGIVFVLLIGLGTGLFLAGALNGNGDGIETTPLEGEDEEEVGPREPALYYEMEPAFVVNLDMGQRSRYLQVKVELMAREEAVINAVDRHMPRIRNSLLLLFGEVDADKVASRSGREALQEESRQQIMQVLEAEGEPSEIEAVFFTNFVMQ